MLRIMLYFILVYEQNNSIQYHAQLIVMKHSTENLNNPNIFQFTEVVKNLECDVYIGISSTGQISKMTREKHSFHSQKLNAYTNV